MSMTKRQYHEEICEMYANRNEPDFLIEIDETHRISHDGYQEHDLYPTFENVDIEKLSNEYDESVNNFLQRRTI